MERAAAAPGRPPSRRSGAPGAPGRGDVSCARRCMAPAGSRGRPRLPTHPGPSREAARRRPPLQPAARPLARSPGSPLALRAPAPSLPTPARPLTPGERGPAAPSRACPSRLAQSRGLRGPSIAQAPRRSLARPLSLLARRLRSLALRTAHAPCLALDRRRRRGRRPYLYGEPMT